MGELVQLPLPHGSYDYLSLTMRYIANEGWSLTAIHRHYGEKSPCPGTDLYVGLSLDELVDLASSVVAVAHERFLLDGSGCHPQLPLW